MCLFVLACEPIFGCRLAACCFLTHEHVGCLCVLVVGLGVDRIVDALRMLTVLTPLSLSPTYAVGVCGGVLGVLLFVLAY